MGFTLSSRRRAGVLYAGVILFVALAVFSAHSIWIAWQQRSGEARAEAVLDLVGQRTPLRPTDAPGAMAWLRLELERYGQHLDVDRARVYRSLAAGGDRAPEDLGPLADAMRPSIPSDAEQARVRFMAPAEANASSLRRQRQIEFDGRTLVVTRRRLTDEPGSADEAASSRFVRAVVPALGRARADIDRLLQRRPLPAVPSDRPPRPVRIYAVGEDGTLVSAPWDDADEAQRVPASELTLLGARPGLPTFAPEEFFFRFDPDERADRVGYSGFYLDLGGRGLVSTLLRPVTTRDGQHGVIALDLAFAIDWQSVAAAVSAPVVGAAVRVADGGATSWNTLESALGASATPELQSAVADLAARDRRAGALSDAAPLRHGLVEGRGAVAAFHVSDATWLLMLFPKTAPAFPLTAVALLGVLLALLLGGFEFNRRRAEDERRGAERALTEKQNLLNTMQVPLVVVDPNTDVIVSSNRAADAIGVHAGRRFADLVWPEPRARAHYERMQVASPEPRRAYGVPVGVPNEHGALVERYALVRSVAVTAPIEALAADERHRLGVLFLLEPDADIALLSDDIDRRAHRDERRKLAGLLSHGVDTLARVLEHCLREGRGSADAREFTTWLAEYLERRLTVSAWLLDHWDATPPLPHDSVVDAQQAQTTLARFVRIFEHVRGDRELRGRLHWNNGTLSAPAPGHRVLDLEIDWPSPFQLTCPVRGGFGWFLGEALTNAVRHGTPGTVPAVSIVCDRIRKELVFRVENDTLDLSHEPGEAEGDAYGGLSILRALARLFDWRDLTFTRHPGRFVACWRVPVSERGRGEAD